MASLLIFLQLAIVLAMIFIGAKVGGIALGIYGMVGVFVLVFVFGLEPGAIPIDVMLIIVSVITASATLQAATVKTLYPVGLAMGVPPMILLVLFPAVNGYFFLPNYPTSVAAIGFDRTGTTRIGKYVVNHSFQLAGFITTFVSIGVGYLLMTLLY